MSEVAKKIITKLMEIEALWVENDEDFDALVDEVKTVLEANS